MSAALDLGKTYFHLEPAGRSVAMQVTPEFWPAVISGTGSDPGAVYLRAAPPGWFMGIFHMAANPPTWEMHPAGDEVLTLMSGSMTVVLEEPAGLRRVRLGPGTTCLVPQGIWHTFEIHAPGDLLALTYGEGTEHRPV